MGRLWTALAALLLASAPAPGAAFDCSETLCPQIQTCAEARYKLEVCKHTRRDSDGDGIPCEALCGSDPETYQARDAASPLAGAAGPDGDQQAPVFTCAGKRTCKQMVSCAEASFYLTSCGVSSLDGDKDGRPCNSLCRSP